MIANTMKSARMNLMTRAILTIGTLLKSHMSRGRQNTNKTSQIAIAIAIARRITRAIVRVKTIVLSIATARMTAKTTVGTRV